MTTMQHVIKRDWVVAKNIVLVAGFALFTALSAQIRLPLPFTPVPITLQTFSVLLAGALLGKRLGFSSQALYVGLGAIGIPVFAGSLGLFGPTGGFLVGFVAAAYLIGAILGNLRASFLKIFLAMLAGEFVLYTLGTIWLMLLLHTSLPAALSLAVLPFLPGEIIKLFSAAVAAYEIRRRF
jgi:biotin transport system substrate-specific component